MAVDFVPFNVTPSLPAGEYLGIAISPDAKWIFAGPSSGIVPQILGRGSSGDYDTVQAIAGTSTAVAYPDACFGPNSDFVLYGEQGVGIWRATLSGGVWTKDSTVLKAYATQHRGVAVSPDGLMGAFVTDGGEYIVFEIANPAHEYLHGATGIIAEDCKFSADGNWFGAAFRGGTGGVIWRTSDWSPVTPTGINGARVSWAIDFSTDGNHAIGGANSSGTATSRMDYGGTGLNWTGSVLSAQGGVGVGVVDNDLMMSWDGIGSSVPLCYRAYAGWAADVPNIPATTVNAARGNIKGGVVCAARTAAAGGGIVVYQLASTMHESINAINAFPAVQAPVALEVENNVNAINAFPAVQVTAQLSGIEKEYPLSLPVAYRPGAIAVLPRVTELADEDPGAFNYIRATYPKYGAQISANLSEDMTIEAEYPRYGVVMWIGQDETTIASQYPKYAAAMDVDTVTETEIAALYPVYGAAIVIDDALGMRIAGSYPKYGVAVQMGIGGQMNIAARYPKYGAAIAIDMPDYAIIGPTYSKYAAGMVVDVVMGVWVEGEYPRYGAEIIATMPNLTDIIATYPKYGGRINIFKTFRIDVAARYPKYGAHALIGYPIDLNIQTTYPKYRAAIYIPEPDLDEAVIDAEYPTYGVQAFVDVKNQLVIQSSYPKYRGEIIARRLRKKRRLITIVQPV